MKVRRKTKEMARSNCKKKTLNKVLREREIKKNETEGVRDKELDRIE
jgi:hypothetical protein